MRSGFIYIKRSLKQDYPNDHSNLKATRYYHDIAQLHFQFSDNVITNLQIFSANNINKLLVYETIYLNPRRHTRATYIYFFQTPIVNY